MLSAQVSELQLTEYWSEADPTLRGIYFEHDPGEHHGRHTDSAEEVVLVLNGEAEVTAGDERTRLTEGTLALVPAMVPHDIANVGQGKLRVVGFFSSAAVVSQFDEMLAQFRTRVLTLGAPEEQPDGSAA